MPCLGAKVNLLLELLENILALHVPVEDAFGAVLEDVIEPVGKFVSPFPLALLVKGKDQAVPICDFETLVPLLNATLLLFL